MWVLVLIVGALLALYFIGKLMGDPDPSKQGDEWLNNRLNSEHAWVRRYLSLPLQQQATESLKNSYQRRSTYITQIENEIKLRQERRIFHDELASVNADLKLIHFYNKRRFNSDTPPCFRKLLRRL